MAADEFRIIVETENKLKCVYPGGILPIRFDRDEGQMSAFELARRTISVFNSWLSNDRPRDRDTMCVIGSHLYSLLFPGEIDEVFRLLWARNAKKTSMRVVLEFLTPAEWLAELPWEFLYLPDTRKSEGFFLCAQKSLILTRTVQLAAPPPNDPISNAPVRILVVLAQPHLEDDVSDELAAELQRLSESIPGRIELRTYLRAGTGKGRVAGPTREDLRGWISDPEFPPDIVHFLGHGRYPLSRETRLEKGELALVNEENGEADWCSDKDFAGLFLDGATLPKLVFLHACEGGKTASYRGFKGLALSLIRAGVPNVVAMQYPVENVVATRFAGEFYKTLLEGAPIDAAVQSGRAKLGTALKLFPPTPLTPGAAASSAEDFSDRRFGSPIVFVQAWLGLTVFGRNPAIVAQEEEEEESIALPDVLPCPYGCKNYHKRDSRYCDQGLGELMACLNCRQLLRKEARVCSYCNVSQGKAAAAPSTIPVAERQVSGRQREAAERFRAAADSKPTHGSSSFGSGSSKV